MTPTPAPSRLARRLHLSDAVILGLGAMVGAGIFAAVGPAARAAGPALLLGLLLATFVAYCNATSSAQLAALHPESGGTYVYGKKRLGHYWGYLAGFGFVFGKLASCSAMALTFGSYVAPALSRPLALAAVVALTALNLRGVHKTARATAAIVTVVLAVLALSVAAIWLGGSVEWARLLPDADRTDPGGVLQAAGLLFFAFAGYARLATLGEEVIDPTVTIPKAIPRALGITLLVYTVVLGSALLAVGAPALAASPAPLATAVAASGFAWMAPVVRVGAAVASLGVLLSLVVGVSRTTFAMAAAGDMPRLFAAVHPRFHVPHRAEVAVGVVVGTVVIFADLREAIGFSSFAVLVYYGVANAAALTLGESERRWPKWIAAAGVGGCLLLAFALPVASVVAGLALFAVATAVFLLRNRAGTGFRPSSAGR